MGLFKITSWFSEMGKPFLSYVWEERSQEFKAIIYDTT